MVLRKAPFTQKQSIYPIMQHKTKRIMKCKENMKTMYNERKSEQAHISHAPTLLENAVYNEWQFQALGTGNRTKKGI